MGNVFYVAYGLLGALLIWEAFAIRRVLRAGAPAMRARDRRDRDTGAKVDVAFTSNGPRLGTRAPTFSAKSIEDGRSVSDADLPGRSCAFLFVWAKNPRTLSRTSVIAWLADTSSALMGRVDGDVHVVLSGTRHSSGIDDAPEMTALRRRSRLALVLDRDASLAHAFRIRVFPTVVMIDPDGRVSDCVAASKPAGRSDENNTRNQSDLLDGAPYKFVRLYEDT